MKTKFIFALTTSLLLCGCAPSSAPAPSREDKEATDAQDGPRLVSLIDYVAADYGGAVSGGAVVSFEVKGGRDAAWRLINATRMLSITANLGDTKSTICHPASTTHGRLSAAEREQANIREGLVRVAVGLESLADLQDDIARGL